MRVAWSSKCVGEQSANGLMSKCGASCVRGCGSHLQVGRRAMSKWDDVYGVYASGGKEKGQGYGC